MKKILINIALAAVIVMFGFFVIKESGTATESIQSSINICLNVIIPSLFGFMILSSIIMNSGIYRYIFKPLLFVLKPLLHLNDELLSVFLLSLVGGYPVGISMLSDLQKSGRYDKALLERMSAYCYCTSPAFAVGIIGIAVFQSHTIGLIIYCCNAISCIILAIFFNMKNKKNITINNTNIHFDANTILNSITTSSYSLYKICIIIIFFNLGISFFDFLGLFSFTKNQSIIVSIKSLLEISNITKLDKNYLLLPIISAISSFGGFCIIFQCVAIGRGIKLKKMLAARIPAALLSGFMMYLYIILFDFPYEVFNYQVNFSSSNVLSSICIIIMTVIIIKTCETNKKSL